MDLAAIERQLRDASAGAIVTDPRLLRRVIKTHLGLSGLGFSVPHARCYALGREALLEIVAPDELGASTTSLPAQVILLARPSAGEVAGRTPAEILTRLWRSAFHAQVHLAVDERLQNGALSDAVIRQRIDRIGQTEFDEIRATLRHDDRLLPPGGDREAYTEFAALYFELLHFAPHLLATMFPGLPADGHVDRVLAEDVDPLALLDRSCPEGADKQATVMRTPQDTTSPTFSTGPAFTLAGLGKPKRPTPRRAKLYERAAQAASRRGNLVRAALLRAIAASGEHEGSEAERGRARADLESLGNRLNAALAPPLHSDESTATVPWTSQLVILAEQAAARRGLRFPVEARLLYDLQRAAVAHERPQRAVDLVTWALSWGKQPIVRPLPATRETRVARYVHAAAKKLRHVRIPSAERKLLGKLLRWASERADKNVRAALRPKLIETLAAVGLRPSNPPERLAQDKLIEELLDEAVDRGFIGLGQLRDALSRNQLKLDDLVGPRELVSGDALLQADSRLALALDGVYRGGEIYLRGLQKVSSIPFGTQVGRLLTLYLVLPFGGAALILEGATHLVNPLLGLVGLREVYLLTTASFFGTAAVVFGLLHSDAIRAIFWRALGILGWVLALVFYRIPRWIFTRPKVRELLSSNGVRIAIRRVIVPLLFAAAIWYLTPLSSQSLPVSIGGAFVLFVGSSFAMGSRLGELLADAFFDWLGPTWQVVSRRVLPDLLRLIADTFRSVMDLVERAMYRVDELLRFREGDHRFWIVPKAVIGLFWFVIAYVVRLYVTLLIEPEINPLKHIPVVTVAAKLMIPLTKVLLSALYTAFSPLGPVIATAAAGATLFVLPGFFGFLAWELKENWKLYRASRPKALAASPIGHHGETMGGLMIPGVHSGTLPKLYERWRRAAEREDAEAVVGGKDRRPMAEGSQGRFREGLHDVEQSVRRFFERELAALLMRSPRWKFGAIDVGAVELGSNRVRVKLSCAALAPDPAEIAFDEQSGLVLASVWQPGFLLALEAGSEGHQLFENALAGVYQLAGVDLVREQVEAALGEGMPYDVTDEGLVVWPGKGYATEAVYRIRTHGNQPMLEPIVRGPAPEHPPAPVDPRRLLYRYESISWAGWVYAWTAAEQLDGAIPRLLRGAPILPAGGPAGARQSRAS